MTFENQRLKLSGRLTMVQRPGRYTGGEYNAVRPDPEADFRFCLLFPDIYEIGVSYHGYSILYHVLNRMEGLSCERSYLPWRDMQSLMHNEGVRLFSIESGRPLQDFDAVGITLQTELHYPGILRALDLAGIPRRSSERGRDDPLIIGGGPCAFHPEPVAPFFDAFLVGDGEEALPELVQLMRCREFRSASRRDKWLQLARLEGVYVPELYTPGPNGSVGLTGLDTASRRVRARVVTELKAQYYTGSPVVPLVRGAHDRLTVEIMRGCSRGCRFCQAGMLHRPVRERPVADIIDQVVKGLDATGWDEVGLLSLSTSDYSCLDDLLAALMSRLSGRRASLAFPSLHPTTFSEEMARVDLGGRKSGVTFAVEAGSRRLRNVINKGLSEEALVEAVERAYRLGWKTVKLYFMVGLPTERMDDIDEGARLLQRLARITPYRRELHVSVSPFIPKPHSVFAREEFLDVVELRRRIRRLYSRVSGRRVKTSWHDPETSLIEALLARGSRRLSGVISRVADGGYGLDCWNDMLDLSLWHSALDEHIPGWHELLKAIPEGSALNWAHIS
ncbi:MAG TPA: TIGR03960 family B12-binding radical SAM protein, partial [Bacteroidetes bacterium]|nr:TIGR03960 family B12-binding radical SAM protein [Bacteroidota bacterium]